VSVYSSLRSTLSALAQLILAQLEGKERKKEKLKENKRKIKMK